MDANQLRIPKVSEGIYPLMVLKNGVLSTSLLERQTRYFPYTEDDTLLFSRDQNKDLKLLIDPVKVYLMAESITDEQVETSVAVCILFAKY